MRVLSGFSLITHRIYQPKLLPCTVKAESTTKAKKKKVQAHLPRPRPKYSGLIPVSLAWSMPKSPASPPTWDASPLQVFSQQYVAGTHLNTTGWREIKWSKVTCLRTQRNWRGLTLGPPDLEVKVLTTRPHMPHNNSRYCLAKSMLLIF